MAFHGKVIVHCHAKIADSGRWCYVCARDDHDQTDTSSEILFITNLPLLQNCFENETLNLIKGDTLLHTPPNIKLPEWKWFQQQTMSRLAVDHETSMSLNKLSELAKREQILYSHNESPILEGEIESDTTWLITKVLFPITAIVITLTAISSAYLLTKHFPIMVAIAALQVVIATVKAQFDSIYEKQTDKSPASNL